MLSPYSFSEHLMSRRLWSLVPCLALVAGCLLEPGGSSRDHRIPEDAIQPDVPVPPGDVVEGGTDPSLDLRDLGETPDPGVDPAPTDVGGMDLGGDGPVDVGGWDTGSGECREPPPATYANFEVFGFPTEGSPMPPWGQGVIFGSATLARVEETRSGHRYVFRMEDGSPVTIETNLPLDQGPPFEVGDPVTIYAAQQVPWWRDLVLVLWDGNRTPRFLYHSASSLNTDGPWYPIPETPIWWPTARGLADPCPPVEGDCGMRNLPPVELLAFGGVASSEVPMTFRRGEEGRNEANRAVFYRVLNAYAIQPGTYQCADYPTQWLEALIRVDGPECDLERIGFSRDNPDRFDFYEICLPAGDEDAEAMARGIDPSLSCGVSGVFARCKDLGATGCHGNLQKDPETGRIAWESWFRICLLSREPFVLRMAGGHYL